MKVFYGHYEYLPLDSLEYSISPLIYMYLVRYNLLMMILKSNFVWKMFGKCIFVNYLMGICIKIQQRNIFTKAP